MKTAAQEFIENIRIVFKSQKALGDKTFAQLSESEMHYTPDADTNSIAILIQHMSGNMHSRFTDFYTSDGEKPNRNRDSEFEDSQLSKEKLLEIWENGWSVLINLLNELKEEDLMKTVRIRTEPYTVLGALNRQVSHYGYHTGQIVQLGKLIKKHNWQSLSIPKNQSQIFNDKMMKNNK